jgi:type IV pilus assembly protein PilB
VARAPLGKLLKDAGLVGDEQLRSALAHQGRWGCRLGEALLDLRIVRPPDLLAVLSMQLGVPAIHIGDRAISEGALKHLPYAFIAKHRVLPLAIVSVRGQERLAVALTAPDDLRLVNEAAFAAAMPVEPVLVMKDDLDRAIARHCGFLRPDALELPPEPSEPMRLVDGRVVAS